MRGPHSKAMCQLVITDQNLVVPTVVIGYILNMHYERHLLGTMKDAGTLTQTGYWNLCKRGDTMRTHEGTHCKGCTEYMPEPLAYTVVVTKLGTIYQSWGGLWFRPGGTIPTNWERLLDFEPRVIWQRGM